MGNEAKRQYLKRIQGRYQKASRGGKKLILDEFCRVCGYNRKYAIRLLNRRKGDKPRKRGRETIYGPELTPHIRELWFEMEQMSARRMKKALQLWLRYYAGTKQGLACTERNKRLLRKISASTLGRFIKQIAKVRGLSSTRPNYALKNQIPIEIMNYKITKPGAMQADTVVHANANLSGSYAHSLTMTDIACAWTDNRAIWTKDSKQVKEQIQSIEKKLPFKLTWFASDCGSEFLNFRVLTYLTERRKPIFVSRGRPYQKNDQCYVEQKNWTHVRQLFHYDRIDDPSLIPLMNEIYRDYWNPLHNFFFPTVKLIKKEKQGKKIKKFYDEPQTPCQRLLNSSYVSKGQKIKLRQEFKKLNPFELKTEMEKKLKLFYQALRKHRSGLKAA